MSHLSEKLLAGIREHPVPQPVTELKFADQWGRAWRFDLAWPELWLAAEVEGGQFVNGRHNRGASFAKDAQKYNAAALLGWRLLRFPTSWVENGSALHWTLFILRLYSGIPVGAAIDEAAELFADPKAKRRARIKAGRRLPDAKIPAVLLSRSR